MMKVAFLPVFTSLVHGALAMPRFLHGHNRLDAAHKHLTLHDKPADYHTRSIGASYSLKRSIPPCQDGWHMGGCMQDSDDRVFPDYGVKMPNDTPANCVSLCDGNGYSYAGMEYGDECWCSNGFSTTPIVADMTQCSMPCVGDESLPCGGGYRLLWFTKDVHFSLSFSSSSPTATPPPTKRQTPNDVSDPSTWQEGPCMVDQASPRLLQTLTSTTSTSNPMSADRCVSQCESQGMDIAGLESGSECWCGHSLALKKGESAWAREANMDECSTPCGAASEDTCGGPWRMKIFGKAGTLEKYGFGFTRSSSAGSSSNSMITSSTVQPRSLPTPANTVPPPGNTPQFQARQEALLSLPDISLPDLSLPNLGIGSTSNLLPDTTTESVAAKKVLAHHMIGNTYPYTIQTWISDVGMAKGAGIDGFALNVGAGGNSWHRSRVGDAFTAAQTIGGFGMIFSFDMTVLPCQSQADANTLRDYIKTWGPHPSYLTIPSAPGSPYQRIVVSTFAGEYCTFGTGSVREGWLSVIRDQSVIDAVHMAGREIAFVPSWFARVESRKQEFAGAIQGDFHWNGGWPAGNNDINWDTDNYHLQNSPGPLYMASVSPWFFTHYGANSFNKNWIYRADDWLYAERWELLFQHRSQVDLVEIVTWNDYGESSYIGPIEGDQPYSQGWVNGYPHLGFLDMTSYYTQAFKTGQYPPITQEKVYIWSRPHPRDAVASQDSVGRPDHAEWTEDYLWGLVFAASAGQFTLSSGSSSKTFNVVAGVNKFKVASKPGKIRGTLERLGAAIVDVDPGNSFIYTTSPTTYNFNAFMASN